MNHNDMKLALNTMPSRTPQETIDALAMERDATHMAWKADVEYHESEVKKWKHAYGLEYDKVAALKAHHETMAAAWQKVQEAELNRANRLESENDALKAQIAERDAELGTVAAREDVLQATIDSVQHSYDLAKTRYDRAEAQVAKYERFVKAWERFDGTRGTCGYDDIKAAFAALAAPGERAQT